MFRRFKRSLRKDIQRTVWPTATGCVALLLFVVVGGVQMLRAHQDDRTVVAQGNVYQFGRPVGWATGAVFSRREPSVLEFEEITGATKFSYSAEFQYGGYMLKVMQVRQVEYVPSPGASQPNTKLLKVTAKIQ
jgi:hypothetical protein